MNKKILSAIAAAGIIMCGAGESYAWFTGTASSQTNIFKAGVMGIKAVNDSWEENTVDLSNMKCGESKVYNYEISNKDDKHGISTLDMKYKNILPDFTCKTVDSPEENDLLEVARFDLNISGVNNEKYSNLTYNDLKDKMAQERSLPCSKKDNGEYAEVKDAYIIRVILPDNLVSQANTDIDDNKYMGKSGSFSIETRAVQSDGELK